MTAARNSAADLEVTAWAYDPATLTIQQQGMESAGAVTPLSAVAWTGDLSSYTDMATRGRAAPPKEQRRWLRLPGRMPLLRPGTARCLRPSATDRGT